jgi:hypothetical protein
LYGVCSGSRNMKKIILIITILIALITSILPTTVLASDILFEYYPNYSIFDPIQYGGAVQNSMLIGQTFIPKTTHTLTSVKVRLNRIGNCGNINIWLFETSAGKPTGFEIARSVPIPSSSITQSSLGEWYEFIFSESNQELLTAGTKYAIVIAALGTVDQNNYIRIAVDENGTYEDGNTVYSLDYRASWEVSPNPLLDVAFYEYGIYLPEVPSIISNDASNITQYEARLNSTVSNDGYEVCDVRFGYGTTSKAAVDFEDYDTVTDWENDKYSAGEKPYVDIDSLTSNTTYYFRVQIKNSAGTATSNEISFTTLSDFTAPVNFKAVTESTVINLFWVKGMGASTTMIRYNYGSYPTSTTDGTLLYNGTGSNTTHTGLTAGSTIYYTAWSISGVDISEGVNLLATTIIQEEGDVNLTKPTTPVNWFIDIDPTTMENFEPVYSMMNDIADSIDMPHPTFWFLAATTMSVAGGVGVYSWKKSLLGAGIVMLVIMIVASTVHLIPGFMIFLVGLAIISIGTVARRFGI